MNVCGLHPECNKKPLKNFDKKEAEIKDAF